MIDMTKIVHGTAIITVEWSTECGDEEDEEDIAMGVEEDLEREAEELEDVDNVVSVETHTDGVEEQ